MRKQQKWAELADALRERTREPHIVRNADGVEVMKTRTGEVPLSEGEFEVLWLLAMPLLLANIAGNYLGSRLALRGGDRVVRVALGSSMTLLLGSLIFKYMV